LAGLMSRWTSPLVWATSRARATAAATGIAAATDARTLTDADAFALTLALVSAREIAKLAPESDLPLLIDAMGGGSSLQVRDTLAELSEDAFPDTWNTYFRWLRASTHPVLSKVATRKNGVVEDLPEIDDHRAAVAWRAVLYVAAMTADPSDAHGNAAKLLDGAHNGTWPTPDEREEFFAAARDAPDPRTVYASTALLSWVRRTRMPTDEQQLMAVIPDTDTALEVMLDAGPHAGQPGKKSYDMSDKMREAIHTLSGDADVEGGAAAVLEVMQTRIRIIGDVNPALPAVLFPSRAARGARTRTTAVKSHAYADRIHTEWVAGVKQLGLGQDPSGRPDFGDAIQNASSTAPPDMLRTGYASIHDAVIAFFIKQYQWDNIVWTGATVIDDPGDNGDVSRKAIHNGLRRARTAVRAAAHVNKRHYFSMFMVKDTISATVILHWHNNAGWYAHYPFADEALTVPHMPHWSMLDLWGYVTMERSNAVDYAFRDQSGVLALWYLHVVAQTGLTGDAVLALFEIYGSGLYEYIMADYRKRAVAIVASSDLSAET
ncbi:MAG: hypothetical protein KAT30_02390, partial [Candidatus Krumholzibacteria bacterium]|nr:hypothetical protein [Candidatus Krumholzibacteria bacterium]